jgi:hypothetical protein
MIVTPPKLGPNPTPAKLATGYPADAGRTWEHSITGGKAFFQENLKVVTSVGGKFFLMELSYSEAKEVLARPSSLIEISHRLADEVATAEAGAIDMHQTNPDLVQNIEYQCQSSGGWILDHPEHHNSWRTVGGAKRMDGPIETQPSASSGVYMCKSASKKHTALHKASLAQGNRDCELEHCIMGACNEGVTREDRHAPSRPA